MFIVSVLHVKLICRFPFLQKLDEFASLCYKSPIRSELFIETEVFNVINVIYYGLGLEITGIKNH
jgi:hypothetical protein